MPARMSRRVQSLQFKRWLAFECDDVAVFDEPIDVDVCQSCGCCPVCRNGNRAAEMSLQRIHATDVIGMQMRDDYFPRLPAFRDHFIDAFGERLLLFFVRRTGIDDQKFFRSVNQVTARVRSWWTCWRAHRKTDVVWSKRDPARDFAVRMIEAKGIVRRELASRRSRAFATRAMSAVPRRPDRFSQRS